MKLLLEKWRKDPTNKVLVFTKSVKLIEMLEHLLKVRSKYSYLAFVINGRLSSSFQVILSSSLTEVPSKRLVGTCDLYDFSFLISLHP